ncbi:hypothetical protein [Pseudonocardia kunmingensis]|uniref:Phage integrase family protein n=1 Tax=Pseudonocardia kunmingensis TaxID=630975 RepID=A0A543E3H5_9PSEU|nr:hypothetical protein [Pseudonocardia kunmingensis]TQM16154.1 hypothetical protein FB558_2959 [Pseudonocardia kunmingensis]
MGQVAQAVVAGGDITDAGAKELMRRVRHSSVRAAMRYQHSTDRRDRQIAAKMSQRASTAKGTST